jgi:hypothetical protein
MPTKRCSGDEPEFFDCQVPGRRRLPDEVQMLYCAFKIGPTVSYTIPVMDPAGLACECGVVPW